LSSFSLLPCVARGLWRTAGGAVLAGCSFGSTKHFCRDVLAKIALIFRSD
jgi:hypothetical protein